MKSLRQYIRGVLLLEAAKSVKDLDPGDFVQAEKTGSWIRFILFDRDYKELGMIMISPDSKKENFCSGAWEVVAARADHGYGPLIYDIAMEYTGKDGLMADRRSVTADAMAVWDFYLNHRAGNDVKIKQLDILRPKRIRGKITPHDTSDDCPQDKYLNKHYTTGDNWEDGWTGTKEDIVDFLNSSLTKAYYKDATPTLDALKGRIQGLNEL